MGYSSFPDNVLAVVKQPQTYPCRDAKALIFVSFEIKYEKKGALYNKRPFCLILRFTILPLRCFGLLLFKEHSHRGRIQVVILTGADVPVEHPQEYQGYTEAYSDQQNDDKHAVQYCVDSNW